MNISDDEVISSSIMGTRYWLDKAGHFHNVDAPAIIYEDGTECWYEHGVYHRRDGPAIIWDEHRNAWFIYGVQASSNSEFRELAGITEEEMDILVLKHGGII